MGSKNGAHEGLWNAALETHLGPYLNAAHIWFHMPDQKAISSSGDKGSKPHFQYTPVAPNLCPDYGLQNVPKK